MVLILWLCDVFLFLIRSDTCICINVAIILIIFVVYVIDELSLP